MAATRASGMRAAAAADARRDDLDVPPNSDGGRDWQFGEAEREAGAPGEDEVETAGPAEAELKPGIRLRKIETGVEVPKSNDEVDRRDLNVSRPRCGAADSDDDRAWSGLKTGGARTGEMAGARVAGADGDWRGGRSGGRRAAGM